MCVYMCWSWYVCLFGRRPTRRQASKHHKKETIHRHQHDEEKNLQISIACACICKVLVCVCLFEWRKTNNGKFSSRKIFYLFLISIICISSRHVCVHTFSRENWENEKNWVEGEVDVGWVTDHSSGWIVVCGKRGWIIHTIFNLPPIFVSSALVFVKI